MEQKQKLDITCSHCGFTDTVSLYAWIDPNHTPELKDQLLDGSLFSHTCRKCGMTAGLIYPLLYHDSEQKFMVQLMDSFTEDPFEQALSIMSEEDELREHAARKNYRMRTCIHPNDMIEKILIFDQHLDDRVLELEKLTAAVSLMMENPQLHVEGMYYSPSDQEDGFVVMTEDGFAGETELDRVLYHKIEQETLPMLDEEMLSKTRIDHEWAVKAMNMKKSRRRS